MSSFLKTCSKCKKQKRDTEFSKDIRNKDRLRSHCKSCRSVRYSSGKLRNWQLLKDYGITTADYKLMLESQGGVCKICRQSETKKKRNGETKQLSVDHDHKTGKVRGLLCHNCNHLLGNVRDCIIILQGAIAYLQANQNS